MARLREPLITDVLLEMIQTLYKDDHLIAVVKPANLLCVPGLCADDNLFDRVRREHPNARVVHRLDMATSGIVLFPLNHASQKNLGQQFERRQIHKRYAALVRGEVSPQHGEISLPLLCDWPNRPKQKVDWQQGKSAHTIFRVVERTPTATLLHLLPVTGRSHQLRVHCLEIGHPILGDALYNPDTNEERLMLHAEWIEFLHPITGETLSLYCPAPFSFADLKASTSADSSAAI